jgi:Matrixin
MIRHIQVFTTEPALIKSILATVILCFSLALTPAKAAPNWVGTYAPCAHHADLLNREHMDLGVRISTANAVLEREFKRAMDFWSEVLDIDWYEVASDDCSIQLVDGTPEVFSFDGGCGCAIARSQFPGEPGFQGWVAFNPMLSSTPREMFRNAVHEIGHLFGLHHNPDVSSVMFFSDFGQDASLETTDLKALAEMHRLRRGISELELQDGGIPISQTFLKQ